MSTPQEDKTAGSALLGFGKALSRAADFVRGKDASAEDGVELWGGRVGRALALAVVAALAVNLFTHWLF